MSDGKKDFDELTAFLGDYGLFQILVIVLLSISAIPCGYMGVMAVFVADTPEHHCKGSINCTQNGTDAEQSSWIGPSCSRDKLNGSRTETAGLDNDTEQCVDGWVYSTEIYTATIVSEWDLVGDIAWKVPFSTSVFFVGVLSGSFICGRLSDRFGRKTVFFLTMIVQAVTALVQAASVSWVMYCVFNFLRGIGQISNYMAALVLGSEMLSPSARVNYTVMGQCLGYGIGYALLPLLAYFIRDWRMLLVASAIPSILNIPMWWVIPESPRWLLQKGRVEEAELVIRNAAKKNNVPAPEVIFRTEDCLWLMQNKGDEEHTYTYMDLIRTPNIRNITFIGVFIWMSVALVYFGLSLNTSNVNGNVYLNCFISAAADIAACLVTRLLIFSVPRPTFLSSAMMVCGIMFLLIQLVPNDTPVLFQVFAIVGRMGVASSYCFLFVVFTELTPTVVRNMSLGVYSTAACTSTIISPFLIYMGSYSKFLPYIIFGTVSIMAAGLSLLLPDTRYSKLPDLISQARPLRGCCCPKATTTATEGCEDTDKNSPC